MKYKLVKESLDSGIQISVQRATQLLGVSRCGFYKWLRSKSGQVNVIPDMDVRNPIESGMGFRSAGDASDGIWIEAFTQNWR
ncbi:MAG: hypothetical protein ACXQTW_08445 [Candidatus Methanospirareceae archaeon]